MNEPADRPSHETSASARPTSWLAFAAMGMSTAACVAVGVVLGILADSALGTSPLLLFVGLVLGCVAAAASVISLIRRSL